MIVLSNESLGLQPNILNWILPRIIGSKADTSQFPIGFIESLINRLKIILDGLRAMIRCTIPNQGNPTVGILVEQILEKGNCVLGVALFSRLNQALLRIKIHSTVVRLLFAFIRDGNFNPCGGFPPHIPANISPKQMAFIFKQNHQFPTGDLMPMRF